jgi:hypothetical protein
LVFFVGDVDETGDARVKLDVAILGLSVVTLDVLKG